MKLAALRQVLTCFWSLLIISTLLWTTHSQGQTTRSDVISEKNEFGGQTVEHTHGDFSIFTEYFDADGNIAKEETVFTSDYPIDNNLNKINVFYYFGKKIKEERIYTSSFASRTLINRSIDHFDRNTGELVRRENHFVKPFTEFNVIFRENGKKTVIEWHYPDNVEGIAKNVSYLDDLEQVIRTESYFTPKTIKEEGYHKRVYYITNNVNEYKRKSRQEWFYSKEYSKQNNGIVKKVELFHYALGKPVRSEVILYDQDNNLIEQQ